MDRRLSRHPYRLEAEAWSAILHFTDCIDLQFVWNTNKISLFEMQ